MTIERREAGLVPLALTLVVGLAAPLLDSTIVTVAIPTLRGDLHASVSTVQWITTAYLLAMAVAIPVTGWATQRFGAYRVWLTALVLFLAGSVLSGMAWDIDALIGFRALQGIGAGLLIPLMQTLLFRAAAGKPVGNLLAVVSLPALVGPLLGPVIGGLIVNHLDWRWIFYVNPPILLLALLLAVRYVPRDSGDSRQRLDLTGLALLSPALAAVIYGLSEIGNKGGLGYPAVLVPLAAGVMLLLAFGAHALRTPEPAVDLRLFRSRSFSVAAALMFLSGLASFGAMLLLPLYYQQLRGETVLAAGLLLIPQGVGTALSRLVAGPIERWGARRVLIVSVMLLLVGTVPFVFAGLGTSLVVLSAALVVRGLGLGMILMTVLFNAYDGLSPSQIPHASTATRIMQQVGGSFGTAVLAVVVQRGLAGSAGAVVAFHHAFGWALALTLPALVASLLVPRAVAKRPPAERGAEPESESALAEA
jgi:EmrB/QacA subfamily drug resistance transporter